MGNPMPLEVPKATQIQTKLLKKQVVNYFLLKKIKLLKNHSLKFNHNKRKFTNSRKNKKDFLKKKD